MDGFTIASSAAGLVSLGITVCHGLLIFYESWKGGEEDVKRMYTSVEQLTKTLTYLRRSIQQDQFSRGIVERVEESIQMCENGLLALRKKLLKINGASHGVAGWNYKLRSQFRRALYPFKESTIVKLKEICSDLQSSLGLALETLQIDSTSISLQSLDSLRKDVSELSLDIKSLDSLLTQASLKVDELHSFQKDNYISTVYDWLSPLSREFGKKQYDTFNATARQDRLGDWVFQTDEYQEWLQGGGKTLWCIGIRGVGKTVLVSMIVNALQAIDDKHIGITYIYFNYSEAEKQNPTNLLKSILLQLVSRNPVITEEMTEAYKKHAKEGTTLTLPECCRLLQAAIVCFSTTYLVIDALDECTEGTRDTLFDELRKMKQHISILVTSRHTFSDYNDSESALRLNIEADALDIRHYLDARITESRMLQAHIKKDQSLHEIIISGIVYKAKGMFLLARLHLDSLMAKTTLRKVKSALSSLPEELDRTYDQVLQRIQEQGTDHAVLALKILGWIRYAARPLRTRELQQAVAVELSDSHFDEDGIPEISLVLSVCAGIVTVRENGTMGLVHYTAQEYLERRSLELIPNAQTEIANSCLTYLTFEEFGQGPSPDDKAYGERMGAFPLLEYASRYWTRHAPHSSEVKFKALALAFLKQEAKVASSVQVSEVCKSRFPTRSQQYRRNVRGLWVAASNGLYDLTVALLEDAAPVETEDSEGERPLHRAAGNGHYDLTRLLVEHQASIHAQSRSGATALHCAAAHGHHQIAEFLIDEGATIGTRDISSRTPLHMAASNGHEESAKLLLDRGADIQAKAGYGASALYRAAENGHLGCVRMLVERGAWLDLGNDYDQTALHRAADVGHVAVAETLLEHGADWTIKDYYGFTPRYRALDMGHYEMAALIVKFSTR